MQRLELLKHFKLQQIFQSKMIAHIRGESVIIQDPSNEDSIETRISRLEQDVPEQQRLALTIIQRIENPSDRIAIDYQFKLLVDEYTQKYGEQRQQVCEILAHPCMSTKLKDLPMHILGLDLSVDLEPGDVSFLAMQPDQLGGPNAAQLGAYAPIDGLAQGRVTELPFTPLPNVGFSYDSMPASDASTYASGAPELPPLASVCFSPLPFERAAADPGRQIQSGGNPQAFFQAQPQGATTARMDGPALRQTDVGIMQELRLLRERNTELEIENEQLRLELLIAQVQLR